MADHPEIRCEKNAGKTRYVWHKVIYIVYNVEYG